MRFDEFLLSEMKALAVFAGAVTGDPHLAEDVLSDALVIVSDRWARISEMDAPAAYTRRVIVTTFLSDRRKAVRRRTDSTEDLTRLDRPTADSTERIADRDEVMRLLAQLAPKQRVAVYLRYMLDQTDEQIAEYLGCGTATVRSQLSHARATLRLTVTTHEKGTSVR